MCMNKITDFVTEIDVMSQKTNHTLLSNPNVGLGQIKNGPYLPIQSGNYTVDAIETNDFNSFTIIGHY
ncbi:MAG: hypothetical protein BWY19_01223 [bacterium ADurb.Bin212]|nr:MAG: hypothetical protein BWY19_01223 [bacterium ADurb.Bin212]